MQHPSHSASALRRRLRADLHPTARDARRGPRAYGSAEQDSFSFLAAAGSRCNQAEIFMGHHESRLSQSKLVVDFSPPEGRSPFCQVNSP
jgi:hypothetical protein